MTNSNLLQKKNEKIRKEYDRLTKKYSHLKDSYIIQKLSEQFYLSERTINGVLTFEREKAAENKKLKNL